jgi:hypothetical protein
MTGAIWLDIPTASRILLSVPDPAGEPAPAPQAPNAVGRDTAAQHSEAGAATPPRAVLDR